MSRKQLHVIYVPGLGDSNPSSQEKAVRAWRRFGIVPHLFQMNWADKEDFAPKLERLLALIDELAADGKVSLVGASAGGGAVLNAFAQRKKVVSGVVTIAGKFDYPETVGVPVVRKNPAFVQSMAMVKTSRASLDASDLQRIMSVYPIADESVPVRESKLPGTVQKKVWVLGHIAIIAIMISFRAGTMIRFLKSQAKVDVT